MNRAFVFDDDVASWRNGAAYVVVPRSVGSKADLLALFARGLSFPEYFGANWDALLDCLRDLSWVQERRVVIAHESEPALSASELRTYLGVLEDAVASWRDNPGPHELIVLFPKNASDAVSQGCRKSS